MNTPNSAWKWHFDPTWLLADRLKRLRSVRISMPPTLKFNTWFLLPALLASQIVTPCARAIVLSIQEGQELGQKPLPAF